MTWLNTLRLKSKDAETRRGALEKLAAEGAARHLPQLAAGLEDPDAGVREAAARGLVAVNQEKATEALIHALRHARVEVRDSAVAALGYSSDPSVAPHLVGLLQDQSHSVRSTAAAALRRLSWSPASEQEQVLFDLAAGNTRSAAFAGHAAVFPLVRDLKHDTAFVRRAVAEALENIDDPRTVKPLLAAVADSDATVRVSVIHALGKVCNEAPTVALLQRLVRDRDERVRLAAAQVLARRNSPEDGAIFQALLKDSHFEIRALAAQALGKLATKQHADALVAALTDPDNDVRAAAARALGTCGAAAAIAPLVLALGDEDSSVRQAAEVALSAIDHDWANSPTARGVSGQLEELLQSRPAWVRTAVSQLVAKLHQPEAAARA